MTDAPRHALAMLDKLLAEQPERVGQDFSEATRCLAAFRDELAATWRRTREPADYDRLAQVNAVLSVVLGGHYPLGPVPWSAIEAARHALAHVLEGSATA